MPGKAVPAAGGPVLGVSADYHDAAAALVVDGRIVAAAEEERFSRRKHDPALPLQAMRWCLEAAGVAPGDLAAVAYHGKPLTTYERVLRSHALAGPRSLPNLTRAIRSWTGRKLWVGYRLERALRDLGHRCPSVTFVEHHLGHAASAFYPSPYDAATILTFDGVGEWATTSIGRGEGAALDLLAELAYPDSLGLLYSAMTAFCGFEVNDGEAKLMGLAPYGSPTYREVIGRELIHLRPDGGFELGRRWFDFESGGPMLRPGVAALFDGPALATGADPTTREADLARSIQDVLEEAVLGVALAAHRRTGDRRAVLAGGVALNCVANRALLDRGPFDELWVQPASSDAGGALGSALWHHHVVAGQPRVLDGCGDGMRGAALGPAFDREEVRAWLTDGGVHFQEGSVEEVDAATVADLEAGRIVGWFQGAMELGPRALGNRSILADPRNPDAVRRINAAIKRREGFRPLAPAVLAEQAKELFDLDQESPYMLFTAPVLGAEPVERGTLASDRSSMAELLGSVVSPLPACTHVDGSARVQTVDPDRFGRFHALLRAFAERTGCPALVNTSFNRAGEPIVRTPADALRCAIDAGLDAVVIGSARIDRSELDRLAAAGRR